jgi:hypothetical protein
VLGGDNLVVAGPPEAFHDSEAFHDLCLSHCFQL